MMSATPARASVRGQSRRPELGVVCGLGILDPLADAPKVREGGRVLPELQAG